MYNQILKKEYTLMSIFVTVVFSVLNALSCSFWELSDIQKNIDKVLLNPIFSGTYELSIDNVELLEDIFKPICLLFALVPN